MSVKGLQQTISNMENISKIAIPKASAQAVNQVARLTISRSVRKVADTVRVDSKPQRKLPLKLIRGRVRLKKAIASRPKATVRVNRGNLPVVNLGTPKMKIYAGKRWNERGGSVLKVGKYTFPGAFFKQLPNGRWHVLRRTTKAREPIEVVSVPLSTPVTTAFRKEFSQLQERELPEALVSALRNQLRIMVKR